MVFSRGPLAQRQGSPFLCPHIAKITTAAAAVMQEKFVIISVYYCGWGIQPERLNAEGEA